MSCSESPKQAFRLKMSQTLLSQLALFSITPDETAEFVYTQFQNILTSKPNCHLYKGKKIWVVRGYYPNTPVFFKLTVVKTHQLTSHVGGQHYEENFDYWVRMREFKANIRGRLNQKLMTTTSGVNNGEVIVMSNDIAKNVSQTMENSLLGARHDNATLIPPVFKPPKCLTPKGMRPFRYKKSTNGKKHKK